MSTYQINREKHENELCPSALKWRTDATDGTRLVGQPDTVSLTRNIRIRVFRSVANVELLLSPAFRAAKNAVCSRETHVDLSQSSI